jgi:alkylation response protein AidB-like acyl-CoA dehydrogenase
VSEGADPIEAARRVAEDVLFPAALDVDRADILPPTHLAAIADAGLFGAFVPAELGGPGLEANLDRVVEELASGCLATTFVWIQHFGLLGSMLGHAGDELGARWLGPAVRGEVKGGIALGGSQPGPPQLRAASADGGWVLNGTSRWVTGWEIVDLFQVTARTGDDDEMLLTALLDAADQPGLTVTRQHLAAVDASRTVRLDFDDVPVAAERVVAHAPFDPAGNLWPPGLRLNGALAIGVAARCCRLIGPSGLDDELAAARAALYEGPDDLDAIYVARAGACELALRAAGALAVHTGSGSILAHEQAPRLVREALFLLVFGSRPGIRTALLDRLGVTATA